MTESGRNLLNITKIKNVLEIVLAELSQLFFTL